MAERRAGSIINRQRFDEVFTSGGAHYMALDLVRAVRFPHELAWLEAQKILGHVVEPDSKGGLPYDQELAKRFFLNAKETCRLLTQSGHLEPHLGRYKRAKSGLMEAVPKGKQRVYQQLADFMEVHLIDGKLALASPRIESI